MGQGSKGHLEMTYKLRDCKGQIKDVIICRLGGGTVIAGCQAREQTSTEHVMHMHQHRRYVGVEVHLNNEYVGCPFAITGAVSHSRA